jgi:hypothetical protein
LRASRTMKPPNWENTAGSKKFGMARIWALAPNYFKYKMFSDKGCRTAWIWPQAFHP